MNFLDRLFVLFFGLSAVTGCAGMDDSRIVSREDGRVLELPTIPCPQAVSNGAPNAGCYWKGSVIFGYRSAYPNETETARQHEYDHHAGLVHGQWVNGCARILDPGRTHWTRGKSICRRADGSYYEIG